ncbi:zinc ribbon domain-containing protein [Paraburkholderia phymatum]|uniref:zinc ribbon domain-containing protein n=1 Tax=Paraburkholderia phymatum TaxID=148447 RepID=UPI00317AFD0B
MSAETTPAQGFPTPCTRCGGVLYQHADFCPYCGADHPLDRAQRKRAGTQLRAVDTPSHLPAIAPDPSGLPALASADMPIPPLAVPHAAWQAAGRWMATRGVVMLLFVAAFGYAAWLLLGDNRRQDTSSDESTNSASTAGGSISPYTPPAPPSVPRATPQSVMQSAAQSTRGAPTATSVNVPVADITPTRVAPPKPPVVKHYLDLPEALRAAHAGLAHNSLAEAKSALADAMSIEPNNADAAQIQSEIGDREKRRDAALNVASNCAKDKLWSCVREHAAHALAIDVSSADAQSLLERVILSTGWKPLASAPAPATAATNVNNADANANVNTNTNGTPALPPLPPAVAAKSTATATSVTANSTATNAMTNTVTNATANATGSNAASAASGVDAEMRAIIDSGWKHSPSANK